MITIKQLAGITAQHNEIVKRVSNGSLDPTAVKRALQDIIVGKLPTGTNWSPPSWWPIPEQQLARARQLWPNAILPEPPKEFTPWTKSEVLLLHVPDSLDSLWNMVAVPLAYSKHRLPGAKLDPVNCRLSPNKVEYTEPVWLAIDLEHGKGESPDSFWGRTDIAGSEVLSAMIQFPEWSREWGTTSCFPNLAGYQIKHKGLWSNVLSVYRDQFGRRLTLSVDWADSRNTVSSSPSVREC